MTSPKQTAICQRLEKTAEGMRLASGDASLWRTWGPYLSERQWGTVREDYSADGSAWEYFPHDQARSRAYRWGEDGLAGFSDDKQNLCMSIAFWNGQDAILKERLFGLTNAQGNHGEDVKEVYNYLDGLPSHAYMKMQYRYPQAAYPYEQLIAANASRSLTEPEFELIDSGVFNDNRYFDIEIEYAKATPDDVLLLVTARNCGPDAAPLHILPHLWFRNQWSWDLGISKPSLKLGAANCVTVSHPALPEMQWACDQEATVLFCENDTNIAKLYGIASQGTFKDGINDNVVNGARSVNTTQMGTKAAAHCAGVIPAGGSKTIRIRLSQKTTADPFTEFDSTMRQRRSDADEFYAALQTGQSDAEKRLVQRQALGGLLWCKQYYAYDVRRWLDGDATQPAPPPGRAQVRNSAWNHLVLGESDIISMPDSWEYPWFAAWDLAFHAVTLALIDPEYAKSQLLLLTQARAQHPNGQIPAYEWNFGDVNPPVQAWAALQIFDRERNSGGAGDVDFLERIFHKLLLNFTWWVNREDNAGRNIFQGGFLGLDNIGLFDLRKPLPGNGYLDQVDGTAWAATFALNMMRIALELSRNNKVYEDLATKFFEHFLQIAEAIHRTTGPSPTGLWDDLDGFYYDVLHIPGQKQTMLRLRSLVGLIPLLAVEVLQDDFAKAFPKFAARMDWFMAHRPELASLVSDWQKPNAQDFRLMSLMRRHRLSTVLERMLDETEFLSDHGIRSLSKIHQQPYRFSHGDDTFELHYEPGEGKTRIYGGNSNWRGPIWMPINFMIIDALRKFHHYHGDEFKIECPKSSGVKLSLKQIAEELSRRLQSLFLNRGDDGKYFFHEYFHGDTGTGLGASHQTGWTALIALLLQPEP